MLIFFLLALLYLCSGNFTYQSTFLLTIRFFFLCGSYAFLRFLLLLSLHHNINDVYLFFFLFSFFSFPLKRIPCVFHCVAIV